jgi:hypothetical protein
MEARSSQGERPSGVREAKIMVEIWKQLTGSERGRAVCMGRHVGEIMGSLTPPQLKRSYVTVKSPLSPYHIRVIWHICYIISINRELNPSEKLLPSCESVATTSTGRIRLDGGVRRRVPKEAGSTPFIY